MLFVDLANQGFKIKTQDQKINSFPKLQKMQIYCGNCKKHTESTHPRILVLILKKSKSKIKLRQMSD